MEWSEYDYNGGAACIPIQLLSSAHNAIKGAIMPEVYISASQFTDQILDSLHGQGWSGELRIDPLSNITITSVYNQIGLCLQTGNVSRIYADLLKLQVLFRRGSIVCGIIIVPENEISKKIGANVVNMHRLIKELRIFKDVIDIPLVVMGLK